MNNERKSQYYNSLERLNYISTKFLKKLNNKMHKIKIRTSIIASLTLITSITFFSPVIVIALPVGAIIDTVIVCIAKKQIENIKIQTKTTKKFNEFITLEMQLEKEKKEQRTILEIFQLASKHSDNLYNNIFIGDKKKLIEVQEYYANKCSQDLIKLEKIKNKQKQNNIFEKNKHNNLSFSKISNCLNDNYKFDNVDTNKKGRQYIKTMKHLY